MRANLFLLLILSSNCLAEGPDAAALAKDFDKQIQPFLEMYCADCHSGDEAEAGVMLDLTEAPDVAMQFEAWSNIVQKISDKEMPPEDAEQPSSEERNAVTQWIDAGLANFDCSKQPIKPRTSVRRLNRVEYNSAIRDLFGVEVKPADDFPADEVGEGFDNLGSVLALPPLLMEKYLNAAEQVTNAIKEDSEAWSHTFGNLNRTSGFDEDRAKQAIGPLVRKAFRRPIDDNEIQRLMELYNVARVSESDVDSILFVTQGIIASPQFLFRAEEDAAAVDADGQEPTPLDSHAIASRLSFFLWSSIPDEELSRLADEGKLSEPEQITKQVERMLSDPKSRAFVDNFFGQWLQLRLMSSVSPDPKLFPTFDDKLRDAMSEETLTYIHELIKRNGSVLELLDSDYTYLNRTLAEHYGVEGVEGDEFQKVSLKNDRRGGVLTHASILTLTSNPTRTSPVKRGKWILDNVLGTPPPPPPADVPELEEGDELLGSLRERMKQHRENPSCAVCHRKMDALGFGFENFNAIGGWRDKDGKYDIDASGELPDGSTFNKPAELRKILLSSSKDFMNCLTRKLLTYALGRGLSPRDKCVVDDIVEHVEKRDHQFSQLIFAIVTSDTFRYAGHPAGSK